MAWRILDRHYHLTVGRHATQKSAVDVMRSHITWRGYHIMHERHIGPLCMCGCSMIIRAGRLICPVCEAQTCICLTPDELTDRLDMHG